MSEEILLNVMFTGSYLEDKNANIGHEIINLFKTDQGHNYIYVLPYGSMRREHNNKIKAILLVRRCSSKVFEIIAKATDLEQITYIDTTVNKEQTLQHKKQVAYIDENNVTYGGLKPYEIFKENIGNEQAIYITFKANVFLRSVKPIYITTEKSNKNYIYMEDLEHFSSQSPKRYIKVNTKAFNILEKIIEDKSNWERENTSPFVQKILGQEIYTKQIHNFMDIIRKEDDELVFSNLFKYIFDANPSGFCKFAKEVLNINNFNDKFVTLREKENIDLLLICDKCVVVIENKIKSSVNGICDRHNIGSVLVQSQLEKYYQYVEKNENFKKKNKHYFIFAPNYNHIILKNYACGKNYKLIEFSKIYDFFQNNQSLYKDIAYFYEFLYALKKHTNSVNNHHEEIMHKRFADAIYQIKKNKKG